MRKDVIGLMVIGLSLSLHSEELPIYKNIGALPSLVYRWTYSEPEVITSGGFGNRYALKMRKMGVLRLNEKKLAGKMLQLSAMVKAENIQQSKQGVAFQIRYRGADRKLHTISQIAAKDRSGSYDWKKMSITAEIPADATEVGIGLGIQGATGTVYFSDVNIIEIK